MNLPKLRTIKLDKLYNMIVAGMPANIIFKTSGRAMILWIGLLLNPSDRKTPISWRRRSVEDFVEVNMTLAEVTISIKVWNP